MLENLVFFSFLIFWRNAIEIPLLQPRGCYKARAGWAEAFARCDVQGHDMTATQLRNLHTRNRTPLHALAVSLPFCMVPKKWRQDNRQIAVQSTNPAWCIPNHDRWHSPCSTFCYFSTRTHLLTPQLNENVSEFRVTRPRVKDQRFEPASSYMQLQTSNS